MSTPLLATRLHVLPLYPKLAPRPCQDERRGLRQGQTHVHAEG